MAKNKRSVWDELVEMGRRILAGLEDILDPKPEPPRKPARVPVPVRKNPRRPEHNPYD